MKTRLILFQIYLHFLCTITGYANDEPEWIFTPPRESTKYKYYVGRAISDDEAQASQIAWKEASEQAIRENFGVKTKIDSQTYEGDIDITLTKRSYEISQEVELKDFEQVDYYRSSTKSYILYRYSKAAIGQEKRRLKRQTGTKTKSKFSQSGSSNINNKGSLFIETEPLAKVYIDEEGWGETPLKLLGKIPPGSHDIRIEHSDFFTVQEKIIIESNKVSKIRKTLVRAPGYLLINADVSDAQVIINGKRIGMVPVHFKGVSGQKVNVRLESPQANPMSTQEEIIKFKTIEKTYNLSLRPAFITINSVPRGAHVSIDGEEIGGTPIIRHKVEPGKDLEILLSLDGYHESSLNIRLNGNENRVLSNIEMTTEEEAEEIEKRENLITFLGTKTFATTYNPLSIVSQFHGTFGMKLFSWLELGAGISFGVKNDGKTLTPSHSVVEEAEGGGVLNGYFKKESEPEYGSTSDYEKEYRQVAPTFSVSIFPFGDFYLQGSFSYGFRASINRWIEESTSTIEDEYYYEGTKNEIHYKKYDSYKTVHSRTVTAKIPNLEALLGYRLFLGESRNFGFDVSAGYSRDLKKSEYIKDRNISLKVGIVYQF